MRRSNLHSLEMTAAFWLREDQPVLMSGKISRWDHCDLNPQAKRACLHPCRASHLPRHLRRPAHRDAASPSTPRSRDIRSTRSRPTLTNKLASVHHASRAHPKSASPRSRPPYTTSLASQFATGAVVTDTGISMFLDDNSELSYTYNATTNQLTQIQNGSTYVLLDGVQNFQIKLEPMQSADSIKSGKMTYDLLMRATILLTVRTNAANLHRIQRRPAMQTVHPQFLLRQPCRRYAVSASNFHVNLPSFHPIFAVLEQFR